MTPRAVSYYGWGETRSCDQDLWKATGRRVRAALETSDLRARLGGFEPVGCGEHFPLALSCFVVSLLAVRHLPDELPTQR
jgi:hypothetical protein